MYVSLIRMMNQEVQNMQPCFKSETPVSQQRSTKAWWLSLILKVNTAFSIKQQVTVISFSPLQESNLWLSLLYLLVASSYWGGREVALAEAFWPPRNPDLRQNDAFWSLQLYPNFALPLCVGVSLPLSVLCSVCTGWLFVYLQTDRLCFDQVRAPGAAHRRPSSLVVCAHTNTLDIRTHSFMRTSQRQSEPMWDR